jgi:predicted chitinase
VQRQANAPATDDKIVDPWAGQQQPPGPGYTPPGVVNPWPEATQWSAAYGADAGAKAQSVKSKIGPIKAASEIESKPDGGGKKGTPVGPAKLTAADMLAIYKAASVASMLGQAGSEQRAEREAQVTSYVDEINDAFRIMRIDTVEAQALFVAHAVGETGLSKLTEGQTNAFEDDPTQVHVSTSLKTDTGDETGKTGQVLGPRRYASGRHRESGTIDPRKQIPRDGPMDERQFDQTFIGRGAIQVTHSHNYMRVLMYLEQRADELQKEIDANPDAPDAKDKARDVAKLREAVSAIAAEPSMAAKPEYSFLFSMGHMQASPMVDRAASLGRKEDFGGKGRASAGMTGNHTDPRGVFKAKAYTAAYDLLMAKAKAKPADSATPTPAPGP